jgi:hypothetical protein
MVATPISHPGAVTRRSGGGHPPGGPALHPHELKTKARLARRARGAPRLAWVGSCRRPRQPPGAGAAWWRP